MLGRAEGKAQDCSGAVFERQGKLRTALMSRTSSLRGHVHQKICTTESPLMGQRRGPGGYTGEWR